MFAQERFRLFLHRIKIQVQRAALPAEIAHQRHGARKEGVLVVTAERIVARMKIRSAGFKVTDADQPLGQPVNGAFQPHAVNFTIKVKVDTLAAGMHTRIGSARPRNAHGRAEGNRQRLFQRRLYSDKFCLSTFVLGLPAIKGRSQVFTTKAVTH